VTNTQHTEVSLWEKVRGGDARAFGEIFDLHHARIHRQARRLTASPLDADDVTALVFLEAWRKRASVRVVDGSVAPWLAVTTTNVARNVARARRRNRALLERLHESPSGTGSAELAADPADAVGERLDRDALAALATEALGRLSHRDRDVITLCIMQDLSTGQAAAALGVAPGTVKSRLSRAKQRLSAELMAALEFTPTLTTASEGDLR